MLGEVFLVISALFGVFLVAILITCLIGKW